MSETRALVFHGPGEPLEVRRLSIPTLRQGEVLVRVEGCTLCGSDLHTIHGRRSTPTPLVLGHEAAGRIEAFGQDSPHLDATGRPLVVGDRVVWSIVASCGACDRCRRDLPQGCRRAVKYGHTVLATGRELHGGFAEHCLLVAGTVIMRLPDEMPLEVACPLGCSVATAAAVVEAAGDLAGRFVLVAGAGHLGLTAVAMAAQAGAAVVCVDPISTRAEQACTAGARAAGTPDELDSLMSAVGADEIDALLELSGTPGAWRTAWPRLAMGAACVLAGSVFPTPPVELSLESVVRRRLVLRGVHNYAPRHLATAVEFAASTTGQTLLAPLCNKWFELESASAAFAAAGTSQRIGITSVRPRCRNAARSPANELSASQSNKTKRIGRAAL
ncbi:MAG: alcohol dehydrogenase catalytic domain-containing protein [Pirellulales bacterium]|nr:alcohol dehydrogenase catalytic domain-containing protein [Pirellulales bacterium]